MKPPRTHAHTHTHTHARTHTHAQTHTHLKQSIQEQTAKQLNKMLVDRKEDVNVVVEKCAGNARGNDGDAVGHESPKPGRHHLRQHIVVLCLHKKTEGSRVSKGKEKHLLNAAESIPHKYSTHKETNKEPMPWLTLSIITVSALHAVRTTSSSLTASALCSASKSCTTMSAS